MLCSQTAHSLRDSKLLLGTHQRKVLKISVAVLGTQRNVSISVSGRLRCRPDRMAARMTRGLPMFDIIFFRSRTVAKPMQDKVAASRRTSGQQAPTKRRVRYGPKQAAGKAKFMPKSDGSSSRLIHLVNS
eukprot:3370879-Prymnesium_polylepis.2